MTLRLRRLLWIPLFCASAFAQDAPPVISAGGIVNAAGFLSELAPGTLISIFGSFLARTTVLADLVPLPTALDGIAVEVDDGAEVRQAPLLLVSPGQVNAQLPYYPPGASLSLRIRNAFGASNAAPLTLAPAAPALFSRENRALLLHADFTPVTEDSPADAGEPLIAYMTGLGAVHPPVPAGARGGDGGDNGPLNVTVNPVRITVGGAPAEVYFSGLAPGMVGVYQVNFAVPSALDSGTHDIFVFAADRRTRDPAPVRVLNRTPGRHYYASPDGAPSGDGSREKPWDLKTALSAGRVRPGDTIWLLGGSYGNGRIIESRVAGAPQRPVVIRQVPGERATVNGGLAVYGAHVWYWGFEITNTNPDRGPERDASACIDTYEGSAGVKLINLVLHDCNQGVGFWSGAEDAEIYGSLIYYNGYQGPTRGHGHGIYTQNRAGTKHIADNIIFSQFGIGIQAYGTTNAYVEGYNVEGNILFNNGALSKDATNVDNMLFAIGLPMSRIRIENNYTYHTPDGNKGYSRMGWALSDTPNRDVVVRRNYWIGGQSAVELWNWSNVEFHENTCYSHNALSAILSIRPDQSTRPYSWDGNTYWGAGKFRFGTQNQDWEKWRQLTGLDAGSRFNAGRPTGAWTFVRPNKYEPGRAHIVVYNWSMADNVRVDLSSVLQQGVAYEIRDAQNYFAEPVVKGVWRGGAVAVPLRGLQPAAPVGSVPAPPRHTAPEFAAFVLLSKQVTTNAPDAK